MTNHEQGHGVFLFWWDGLLSLNLKFIDRNNPMEMDKKTNEIIKHSVTLETNESKWKWLKAKDFMENGYSSNKLK